MTKISEASIKERVKNLAKHHSVSVNEMLKKLFLERFLVRFAQSEYRNKMIFKGGNLLNYYIKIGRQTTDLDFLLTKIKGEEESIKKSFQVIAEIQVDDGFELSFVRIERLSQPHMHYPGFRVILHVRFINGKLKDNIQIDVGIGDQVEQK